MALAETLIVNPHVVIKVERDDRAINAITVRAPIKGDRLKVTRIDRAVEPQVFAALLVSSATGEMGTSRLSETERVRLMEIGMLIPPDGVSTPVLFSCDATDNRPDQLPARATRAQPSSSDASDLSASPTLRLFGPDGPPPEMRGRLSLRNPLDLDRSWMMVDDDPLAAPRIYSIGAAHMRDVKHLDAGKPVPDSTAPCLRQQLLDARVIESAEARAREREQRLREADAAQAQLGARRFVVLPNLIPPLQLAAARRYYRAVIAEGFLPFGDAQWPDRYFGSKEPLAYFFHQQLTAVVSRVAGQPVKPSFCYFASYRPGAELPAHTDREQCEYSLSILIDESPEPADESPWPLFLQPPSASAAVPVAQGLGDGVLYYGREVTHFRERLAAADFCSFWFFFYVPEGFTGSLD